MAPQEAVPPTGRPPDSPPRAFLRQRLLVFGGILLGYASYYITRSSLTFTAPVMMAEPSLGVDLVSWMATCSVAGWLHDRWRWSHSRQRQRSHNTYLHHTMTIQ